MAVITEQTKAASTLARRQALEQNQHLVSRVKAFRQANQANLEELVQQTVRSLREKGFDVILAATAAEARDYILNLVKSSQVTIASSPLIREIGLEQELTAQGVRLIQTGLQAYPEQEWQGSELRTKVRNALAEAEFGITGADALIAEHGSVANMENQGNVRVVSNLAVHHLVVTSIDKIVFNTGEAVSLFQLLSLLGSGLPVSRYLSFISGPSSTADVEGVLVKGMHGPQRVDVILLDNGRMEALHNGKGQVLQCIGCGGCMEVCPLYQKEAGSYLELFLSHRTETSGQCGQCGECHLVCPMQIDTENSLAEVMYENH